jgi:hypothetical protein
MILLEKLWLAKLNSIAQCGTVTSLNATQFEVAGAIVPTAKTKDELVINLKTKPWTPVIYNNPHNWSEDRIKLEMDKLGLLSLAKIIIKK